jgi:amino acid transporter
MAAINRYEQSSSDSLEGKGYQPEVNIANTENFNEDDHHHLHRGLKARQITMIAIGGAIGTGLIIGTQVSIITDFGPPANMYHSGKSLAQAGPAPLFIGYTLVGFLCFLVMAALGEVCNVLMISNTYLHALSRNELTIWTSRWLFGYLFHLDSQVMQLDLWTQH